MKTNTIPNIKIKEPTQKVVKSCISYYYFMQEINPNQQIEFWHYPHYNSTLLFAKDGQILFDNTTHLFIQKGNNNYSYAYNNNIRTAKKTKVKGAYDIIGIVFPPLGINHFLSESNIFQNQVDLLKYFIQLFQSKLEKVFDVENLNSRVKLLDGLFVDAYQTFEAPNLKYSLAKILSTKGAIELTELASNLQVNRRTLLRHFKQYLGCSYQEFKAAVKFRTALDNGIKNTKFNKLSELAYHANYYDQSEFIKQFKSKTMETPKHTLNEVKAITDQLLWKIALP